MREFAVAGLEEAARRGGRRRGLVIVAIDETGQEKGGGATAGVKRQYLGCAGRVANGINTVHLSYVREKAGHALIGARQWIPREHLEDPVKSLLMGLPLDLGFRTKGQLAIDLSTGAAADGIRPDFSCGDEVYGSCTQLRQHFEAERPGLCAAGAVELHAHPGRGHKADLRGSGHGAAEGQAALGGPLRRATAPRASGGTPGHGLPPPRRATTCSSAATSRPESWPFTTAGP